MPFITHRAGLGIRAVASASPSLIETVTLDNFSGASRTDPYVTFARNFAKGTVPSGSKVEIRYGGSAVTLQQADGRATWADGSLRRAVFSCKPSSGAVADNATLALALYAVSGSFSNSTTISRSTLTGQDYKIRVKISGTDYYCLLNNLDTAGTYREVRAGNTVRAWHHYGVLRNGTGGGATDQGQLQAAFYSYVWSDGTITIWPVVYFGRDAASALYTIDEMEFLNGASSLWLETTDFSTYYSSAAFLVSTDARPYWSANATHFFPRVDASYWWTRSLGPPVYSTSTQRAAMAIPTPPSYSMADRDGDYGTDNIDNGGGSGFIGPITTWAATALLLGADPTNVTAANRKKCVEADRVNALAMGVKHGPWVIKPTTGMPPNYTGADFSGDGLGSSMASFHYSGATGSTAVTYTYAGAQNNASHCPAYCAFQAATEGWEWWLDMELERCASFVGAQPPDNTITFYTRTPKMNGTVYDVGWWWFSQGRSLAWRARDFSFVAFNLPDAHPYKGCMAQMMANSSDFLTALWTSPYTTAPADAGLWNNHETLGQMPTNYGDEQVWSPWHNGYLLTSLLMMLKREQLTTSHKVFTEFMKKQMIGFLSACPYNALGTYGAAISEGSAGAGGVINGVTDGTWSHAYVGGDAIGNCTTKLVSDSGGSSGSCPVSGLKTGAGFQGYYQGMGYPNIHQGWLEMASVLGFSSDVASLLTYVRGEETSFAATEADWASATGGPQWRIRAP